MPTNRTQLNRGKRHLTQEAVDAWHQCDFTGLHRSLDLRPWQASPLPVEVTACGVDAEDAVTEWTKEGLRWQKILLEIAGWPRECRREYEKNLAEAESWRAYCLELVEHPDRGGQGTGSDPASRRRSLEDAEERVAYRRELIDAVDENICSRGGLN